MSDNAFGGFFIGDADEDVLAEGESVISVPLVVPESTPAPPEPVWIPPVAPEPTPAPESAAPLPAAAPRVTREQRLVLTLDRLMEENQEIEAAALVSLDGFTMASALPEGMHEDRVGAMSAAILGLGERAATELGRGHLAGLHRRRKRLRHAHCGGRPRGAHVFGRPTVQARARALRHARGRRRHRRDSRLVGVWRSTRGSVTERALRWHSAETSTTSVFLMSSSW
jgi:hypothetical protein